MRSIVAWFVRNPVAANLLMVAMVVAGLFGFFTMEREFIPTVTSNSVSVSTSWPGASPRDVQDQIVVRVEEAVDGLDGIDYIEAFTTEGSGRVTVYTLPTTDLDRFVDDVKTNVDAIRNLPPDAFRPVVSRDIYRPEVAYLALHGDIDPLDLQREAVKLRKRMSQEPWLQLTNYISKISEQVTVEVSEDALRRYGLTFNEVSQAIGGTSLNLSAGTVETTGGNLQLRAFNLANTKSEFENIIVRQAADGGTVRVGDVANVIDGFEFDDFQFSYKGENAAIFEVRSPDEFKIDAAGRSIADFVEEVNQELPSNLTFSVWTDMSDVFTGRMQLVLKNALQGLVLVLIVLTLFLRPKVALWVTVGILAAFVGAVSIMPALGVTLNILSLFAFLIVIGIVVDDAIVVGESVHFHVENGITGERGAIAGTNMVVKPVFFAVITTMMMFVPFLMITGSQRNITAQISFVVIAVLAFSLIEAFLILPAHLRKLKHIDPQSQNKLMRFQGRVADSLVTFARRVFRPVIAQMIRFRYLTFSAFAGLLVMSFTLLGAGVAPSAFFPEVEGDSINFNASFPEGTSFERKSQVRKQLDAGIKELNANAKADFGYDGELIVAYGSFVDRRVQGFLGLVEGDKRPDISTKQVAEKLEEYVGAVPDAYRVNYNTDAGGGGGPQGLFFGIAADNEDDLRRAILDLKSHVETYPDVLAAWDGLESSAREIRFTLKPGAEALGITLQDVTQQVRQAFYGLEVQRLPRNGEDVRVMVRYPEAARESIDSLETLRVRASNGVEVPLFAIADVDFAEGIGRINRRDRKRLEYTGARVKGGQQRASEIRADIEENFLPRWRQRHPNVTNEQVGSAGEQQELISELTKLGTFILLSMYGLLAIAFRSYAQPLLIMIAIPFAFVGMIFGNLVTGVPFGLFSIFGFFAAAGVAVNDNLILIDYVNRLRDKGVGAYQAMLDACVARFRPILLTSVTTFLGITPILFETSVQAQFLKPMVVALAFGVLFDFFLTLMLVPAMYGIGVDITRFFRGLWRGEKQPGFGSTYNPEMAIALDDFELGEAPAPGTTPPSSSPKGTDWRVAE